jgi:hypothetical protein
VSISSQLHYHSVVDNYLRLDVECRQIGQVHCPWPLHSFSIKRTSLSLRLALRIHLATIILATNLNRKTTTASSGVIVGRNKAADGRKYRHRRDFHRLRLSASISAAIYYSFRVRIEFLGGFIKVHFATVVLCG